MFTTNAATLLQKCDINLEEFKHTARRGVFEKAMWKQANHCMIRASTSWAFVGAYFCFLKYVHIKRPPRVWEVVGLMVVMTALLSVQGYEVSIKTDWLV